MPNNESIKNEAQSKNIQEMFNNIAGRYDFLNGLLSLNLDNKWRKKAIEMTDIKAGHTVLDLACGTGDLTIAIRKAEPACKVIGGDFSINMLHIASKKVPDNNFIASDAHFLPFKNEAFDRMTIAFGFRNVTDKAKGLSEFYRILKPGGRACILELTQPENPVINFFYKLYFKHLLPAIGGLFSSKKAYEYLPASVYNFPKRKEYTRLIEDAGFKNIHFKTMLFGAVTIALMDKENI